MGKTPDEIKKGARHCISDYSSYHCGECPYRPEGSMCKSVLHTDLLSLIQHLESSLAQAERERNLLVSGLEQSCDTCKHRENMSFHAPCNTCSHLYRFNAAERGDTDNWEWRGVCKENTKDGADA